MGVAAEVALVLVETELHFDKTETLFRALRVSKNVADAVHRLRRNPPIDGFVVEIHRATLFPQLETFDVGPSTSDSLDQKTLKGCFAYITHVSRVLRPQRPTLSRSSRSL